MEAKSSLYLDSSKSSGDSIVHTNGIWIAPKSKKQMGHELLSTLFCVFRSASHGTNELDQFDYRVDRCPKIVMMLY